MALRFVILLAIAGGLAVYLVMRPAKAIPTDPKGGKESYFVEDDVAVMTPAERAGIEAKQKLVAEQDLPGDEPSETPQFDVRTEVNLVSRKNQLCFYVSEAHGYFIDSLRVQFWYAGENGNLTPENSPLTKYDYLNTYIKANETLRQCIELTPPELNRVGGDIGTSKNWAARIEWYNRARLKNPDPLPVLND